MLETILYTLGRFHPLFVHLPIGIIIAVVLMEWLLRDSEVRMLLTARRFLLTLSLLAAIGSVVTGLLLESEGGYSGATVTLHKWLGIFMTLLLTATTVLAWGRGENRWQFISYRVCLFLTLVLMVFGSHHGAVMTHGRDFLTEHLFAEKQAAPAREPLKAEEFVEIDDGMLQFERDILPILEASCIECHGPDKQKSELRMDTLAFIEIGSEYGPAVVPGEPDESPLYYLTTYHPEDPDFMPEDGEPLTEEQQETLRLWIEQGANLEVITPATPAETQLTAELPQGPASSVQTPSIDLSAIPEIAPSFGENWLTPVAGVEMLWIAPGTFQMGSPGEETGREAIENLHTVNLSQGFWLGKYEVTQAQWARIMESDPASLRDETNKSWPMYQTGPDYPMYYVSRLDAKEFCSRLTEQERAAGRLPEGYFFSLPTEAQWEYACRAGTMTPYNHNDLSAIAWFRDNSDGGLNPVGQKLPNAWGLHDMHGNVWEWCFDTNLQYAPHEVTDPVKVHWVKSKVVRGGSWRSKAEHLRSAYRHSALNEGRNGGIGFRLALIPRVYEWSRERNM